MTILSRSNRSKALRYDILVDESRILLCLRNLFTIVRGKVHLAYFPIKMARIRDVSYYVYDLSLIANVWRAFDVYMCVQSYIKTTTRHGHTYVISCALYTFYYTIHDRARPSQAHVGIGTEFIGPAGRYTCVRKHLVSELITGSPGTVKLLFWAPG